MTSRSACFEHTESFVHADPPRIIGTPPEDRVWDTANAWVSKRPKFIVRVAGIIGTNLMSEQDLLQEAKIVAFQTLQEVLQNGELEVFVRKFAFRFKSGLRRQGLKSYPFQFPRMNIDSDIPDSRFTVDNLLKQEEIKKIKETQILKALETMTSKQRQVWELFLGISNEVEKPLSHQEIGKFLGFSTDNVFYHLRRGLNRVKRARGISS